MIYGYFIVKELKMKKKIKMYNINNQNFNIYIIVLCCIKAII